MYILNAYHRKFGKRKNAFIWSVGHRWKELLDTNFSLNWPLGGFSLNIEISMKKMLYHFEFF